jgi:MYXO-CTERM domain-containing protein
MTYRAPVFLVVLLFSIDAHAGFVVVEDDVGPAATHATGATLVDLDGDGHVDFLSAGTATWLGNGDATFTEGPLCEPGGAPVVADFDNDGHLDVLRVRDEPVLCFGQDGGTFVPDPDAVEPSPYAGQHQGGSQIPYSGTAADFDGDGWVDLYMTEYEDGTGGTFIPFPDLYYMNDGSGRLDIVAETPAFQGRGVTAADYDDDGDPDIYVSNYRLNRNFLWRNEGNGNIVQVADELGAEGSWGHTISSAFGDINGDGNVDILVGNFAHPGQPTIMLLLNDLEVSGQFVDVEDSHGITWQESYASVAVQDYDNDGDLDTFITTVYAGDNGRLYRNRGDGWHDDVTAEEGLSGQTEGYGVSWADVNEDGFLDLYLGGQQTGHLYLGEPNGNHFLRLRFEGDGEVVNRAAIGTRVRVETGDLLLVREVQAGGTGGDRGSSDLVMHLGLGDNAEAVDIEVRWPWAETCIYHSEVDTTLTITYDPDAPECAEPGTDTGTDTGSGTATSVTSATTSGTAPTDTQDTGSSTATDIGTTDAGADSSDSGCGCRSTQPAPWWLVFGLLLIASRRRSPS